MKILVAISCVPDTTSKINFTPDSKSLDKNGIQFVINPYDEFCLTKAIQLQEQKQTNVTVVTVGDSSTEPVIRKALAIGADEAIRVNSDASDSFSVAQEIAEIAKQGNFDLLFFGKESIDYNGGIVPSLVAGMLELPFINACIGLDVNDSNAKITREIDGGKELVSANLPLAIAGQKGIVEESELKIPNMRGIMLARKKNLNVVESKFNSNTIEVIDFEKPLARKEVQLIDKDNVEELVRILKEDVKVI
ncbi:MAG: electron transfer flavoprotein subunit beta/FixA family protein [Flavobacteriales bacterium]|nr:electron transfer flavoprotein subunit beta/FixA family protein [Flavobacteriales bacterium]